MQKHQHLLASRLRQSSTSPFDTGLNAFRPRCGALENIDALVAELSCKPDKLGLDRGASGWQAMAYARLGR